MFAFGPSIVQPPSQYFSQVYTPMADTATLEKSIPQSSHAPSLYSATKVICLYELIRKHTSPMRNSTPSLHTCLYLSVLTQSSHIASMRHLSPYGTPFGNSYLQFTWISPFAGRIAQFNCCSTVTQFYQYCVVS